MRKDAEIKVVTYEEDRLNYFTNILELRQRAYDRAYKHHGDHMDMATHVALKDLSREIQFYKDVVEIFKQGEKE